MNLTQLIRLTMVDYSTKTISHKFVDLIPEQLEDEVIYISLKYATATHKCCCGCQMKVVTPISPTDWQLAFNGKFVSLFPSIGNWSFPCMSHYWITNNQVQWAGECSKEKISAGRARDYMNKRNYYGEKQLTSNGEEIIDHSNNIQKPRSNFWTRLKKRWF